MLSSGCACCTTAGPLLPLPVLNLSLPVPPHLLLQLVVLPPVHELQRGEDTRYCWINYSAFDAKSTFDLYQRLREELRVMPATLDPAVQADYAKVGAPFFLLSCFWAWCENKMKTRYAGSVKSACCSWRSWALCHS